MKNNFLWRSARSHPHSYSKPVFLIQEESQIKPDPKICLKELILRFLFFHFSFFLEPPAAAPASAELWRHRRPPPWLGDGEGSQRTDLLHEPYHQDHTVGGSQKGEPKKGFNKGTVSWDFFQRSLTRLVDGRVMALMDRSTVFMHTYIHQDHTVGGF